MHSKLRMSLPVFAATLAGLATLFIPGDGRAENAEVEVKEFSFTPASITVTPGSTVTWRNQGSLPHTSTSDTGTWNSPVMAAGQSFTFTFSETGTYAYHCAIHPSMKATVVVAAAAPAGGPTLSAPPEGATLTGFGPHLSWVNPPGATQVHLQIIPTRNDGPGVDLHLGGPAATFDVPAPPTWYGLLPDMTYTWRVRTSAAAQTVPLDDPSWSAPAEGHFRTPAVSSATITLSGPAAGDTVESRTPTLRWTDSRSDVFYYEVQLSQDQRFNTDPATAMSMVYWELRHGGVSTPPNSYTVPQAFPLSPGQTYYWRVRPRVQGDGTPVAWTPAQSFRVGSAPSGTTPTATPTPTATRTSSSPPPTGSPTPTPTRTPAPASPAPYDRGY